MSRNLKIDAARAALALVENGMKLGIGTGSTADEFVRLLAEKIADGLSIVGVPTSEKTAALCRELSVPLTTLEETPQLDLTIDGADEVDNDLNLIKGGGGALLREKIVAFASREMVVIADSSKLVPVLGEFPLPVEVNPFGLNATRIAVEAILNSISPQGKVELRMRDGKPFITDGGHFILDTFFGRIPNPNEISENLLNVPGVVQHGLFLSIASQVFIAGNDGITHLTDKPD
ncbi:MAG: ribose-5-phosphate isomerase RpiA [Rhizobiaceae bacterium]|nr:ribose-5-phosphate isomerase RpiA [Rhizobiaceae bacterium]